jgi:transcriptional regulator with XRE-family HTH domain
MLYAASSTFDPTELARRVKELRRAGGLSREVLAVRAGLALRTLVRIENAEGKPREATLRVLAAGLGVTFDELLDGDDPIRR